MAATKRRVNPKMRYYKRQTAEFLEHNLLVVVLAIFFILGTILGTKAATSSGDLAAILEQITGNFIAVRTNQDLNRTLLAAFSSSASLLLLVFLCGFSAVLIPVIFAIPFIKGISFGISAAGIIGQMGGSGILFTGLLLLPNTIISTIILLYSAKNAIMLSRYLLRFLVKGERGEEPFKLSLYCIKFMFYTLILAGGALLESVLFKMFAGMIIG